MVVMKSASLAKTPSEAEPNWTDILPTKVLKDSSRSLSWCQTGPRDVKRRPTQRRTDGSTDKVMELRRNELSYIRIIRSSSIPSFMCRGVEQQWDLGQDIEERNNHFLELKMGIIHVLTVQKRRTTRTVFQCSVNFFHEECRSCQMDYSYGEKGDWGNKSDCNWNANAKLSLEQPIYATDVG